MTTDGFQYSREASKISDCDGKAVLTPERARKIAKRMTKFGRTVEAYRCRCCNEWHVGNPSPVRTKKGSRK